MPDFVQETFHPGTDHSGRDGADRALRYLEWTFDPDPADTTFVPESVFLLRKGSQPVRVEHEQHIHGLFPRAEWVRLLHDVGFTVTVVRDSYDRDLFVARRF